MADEKAIKREIMRHDGFNLGKTPGGRRWHIWEKPDLGSWWSLCNQLMLEEPEWATAANLDGRWVCYHCRARWLAMQYYA